MISNTTCRRVVLSVSNFVQYNTIFFVPFSINIFLGWSFFFFFFFFCLSLLSHGNIDHSERSVGRFALFFFSLRCRQDYFHSFVQKYVKFCKTKAKNLFLTRNFIHIRKNEHVLKSVSMGIFLRNG